jgi:murein DD-endopeptidase MepM/ murein hydrolase activator NlpD
VDDDVTSVGFLQDVRITHQYTSTDKLQERTLTDMQSVLTANTNGATTYVVVSGDTLSGIAYRNNMSLREIVELNPNISAHNLSNGQTIIIREVIPYLSVTTTKTLTYEDAIPFDTQYVDNNNMYQGDSKVVKAGVNGKAIVTADITYVNGQQTESTILSSNTTLEPTTQIVEVGTAPRPKTAPTGAFKWPVYGSVTSRYGYRTIFGSYSFHSGIDIAAPYGTTIRASDGGTVTYAGYKGSYGYLIIITHGSSGKQTYYAHCSKFLVSTGTKVYQGQPIARVGLSGRTTGSHLHFEVRIDGRTVNPLSYLK